MRPERQAAVILFCSAMAIAGTFLFQRYDPTDE